MYLQFGSTYHFGAVEVNLKPNPDMSHMTSCRDVSIEQRAAAFFVFFVFWLVLLLEARQNFIWLM